jgi:hypothetical protein
LPNKKNNDRQKKSVPDYSVHGDSVNEADDAGQHLDLQLLHEKRCLFSVDSDEFRLEMFGRQDGQVFVDDFAAHEFAVVKRTNSKSAFNHWHAYKGAKTKKHEHTYSRCVLGEK